MSDFREGLDSAVVGFGAGALDIILPPGDVGRDHMPSVKGPWRDDEDGRLVVIAEHPDHESYLHVGGNVVNALAFLALQPGVKTSFVGVTGIDGTISSAIRQELERFGIADKSVQVGGYRPSISIVERLDTPGSDRMIRGRPRDPMDEYLSNGHIRSALRGANVAVVSSTKSAALNRRIFELASGKSLISFNPGSSEFTAPDSGLLGLMSDIRPDLLSLNDDELRALFDDGDTSLEDLALRANRYATNVLCTLGKDGILFAYNGQVTPQGCSPLGEGEEIRDKMGAGDRAHAVAVYHRLLLGEEPDVVLPAVDAGSTQVIQFEGAHGDLYSHPRIQPVTLSL